LEPPRLQLGLGTVESLRAALGRVHLERQLVQFLAADRLGQDQPGERAWPYGQQAVFQARPDRRGGRGSLIFSCEQAVRYSGDLCPAGQRGQCSYQGAGAECLAAATGGNFQGHFPVPRPSGQGAPGG
jgi:hypothetical protein